jgi:hypothetical protein
MRRAVPGMPGGVKMRLTNTHTEYVKAAWSHIEAIRNLYSQFARKRPVMLLELATGLIYAYPYREFKADLSVRSGALLEEQYAEATQNGEMVVFVRDDGRRKFVSFNLPTDDVDHPGPNRGCGYPRGRSSRQDSRSRAALGTAHHAALGFPLDLADVRHVHCIL